MVTPDTIIICSPMNSRRKSATGTTSMKMNMNDNVDDLDQSLTTCDLELGVSSLHMNTSSISMAEAVNFNDHDNPTKHTHTTTSTTRASTIAELSAGDCEEETNGTNSSWDNSGYDEHEDTEELIIAGSDDCDQSTSNNTGVSPDTTNANSESRCDSNATSEESLGIAKKENLRVKTWRLVMFGVLIVTTIVVAVTVFQVVRLAEKEDFETAFKVDSQKIYEAMSYSMETKLEAVDSLALTMVSSAKILNQTWPFTLLPDFASKAAKTRILSDAIALQQYQVVENDDQRLLWEAYAKTHESWVQEGIDVTREDTTLDLPIEIPNYETNHSTGIRYKGAGSIPYDGGPYTPTWQTYPTIPSGVMSAYNFDAIQHELLGPGVKKVMEDHRVVVGPVLNYEDSKEKGDDNRVTIWAQRHVSPDVDAKEPVIRILYPILDTAEGAITVDKPESKVVGIIASSFFWRAFLENILPDGEMGLVVVFRNTCNQTFTYEVNGHGSDWLGPGDLHETEFDYLGCTKSSGDISMATSSKRKYGGLSMDDEFCAYTLSLYPSMRMKDIYVTSKPFVYSIIAVCIFCFTALVFVGYDKLVAMRQQSVMKAAVQSTTIISSLFPSNIRDRLMENNTRTSITAVDANMSSMLQPHKTRLRTFLNNGEPSDSDYNKPIADLFTDTTVLFADIAGFTAWSSVREPTQVFTLLETVYGAFDTIAARRNVFKVETIGDSYVAVTGLPDPRKDHAVVMVKFARDCREQFNELCSALENTLGPETGDLQLRIGIHSGPVTAGVLRGQKSRFQLFGDTVNTAARMESTGKVNKIQVSQATADLLRISRKSHWLQARDEMVEAKGKGLMITYWVEPKVGMAGSTCTTADLTKEAESLQEDFLMTPRVSSATERLINWNIDVLERHLKNIVARRIALKRKSTSAKWKMPDESSKTKIVLQEVREVIKLPEYDSKYSLDINGESIVLVPRVRFQLREFVTTIALTYQDENPFHNFSHASHVGMSVAKLLSRIVAPDIDLRGGQEQLHDHTYGITSDPLTQFACVFSALIHDADHPGVPNSQLVKEGTAMARTYKGKSVAEQNSINLAWSILLEDKYTELRKAICKTKQESIRFRQLVVNAVCATDIIDKDLKAARNKRWEKAFSLEAKSVEFSVQDEDSDWEDDDEDDYVHQINRKATIVIEHIIQASDVAHTMQHWHIYIKWNERLFDEMYKAYMEGRAAKDPTPEWYKGELGFFDFYIIPLAQKLSECGVFGVSSDEYLNYAIMNRNEWEKKGKDVVAGYVKKYQRYSERTMVVGKLDKSAHSIVDQP